MIGEPGVVGETINIKEAAKVHQGVFIFEGNKQVVQEKLEEIESSKHSGEQGKVSLLNKPTCTSILCFVCCP